MNDLFIVFKAIFFVYCIAYLLKNYYEWFKDIKESNAYMKHLHEAEKAWKESQPKLEKSSFVIPKYSKWQRADNLEKAAYVFISILMPFLIPIFIMTLFKKEEQHGL